MAPVTSPRQRTANQAGRSGSPFVWLTLFVAIGVIVGGAAGYALSYLQTPRYKADAYLFLATTQPFDPLQVVGAPPAADNARYLESQSQLLTSVNVLSAASKAIAGHPSVKSLQDRVSALSDDNSNVLTITVTEYSRQATVTTAAAVARAYRRIVAANVTSAARAAAAKAQPADASQILAAGSAYGDGVFQFEPAQLPDGQYLPSRSTDFVLGALAGLLIGAGLAARRHRRYPPGAIADPLEVLRAPFLGTLHLSAQGPDGQGAQSGQSVLTALGYASGVAPSGSVLVLGMQPAAGASSLVAALAAAQVRQGRELIVVDAHPNRQLSGLAGAVALDDRALAQVADGSAQPRDFVQPWNRGPGMSIDLLSCAPGATRTRAAISRLSVRDRLVLVDGPPITSEEGFALAGAADSVVLVIPAANTAQQLAEARGLIELAGTHLAGFVIVRPSSDQSRRPRLPLQKDRLSTTGARA